MFLTLNPSDFWQFQLFIGLIIDNHNSIVNNLDRFVFSEYPNRYSNWVSHLGTQRFQLTPSGINKMVNKHIFALYPSPSGFNVKDTSSHISRSSLRFYLSSEYLFNFFSNFSNLLFHHDWEKFSNFCSDYREIHLQVTKSTLNAITCTSQSAFSPGFYHHS